MDNIEKEAIVLAVTGHRPVKLGGYSDEVLDNLGTFAYQEVKKIAPDYVITGMAMGWDLAIAQACVDLDIPYSAAVPCDGQDALWPVQVRQHYQMLLKKATSVNNINPGPYAPWKMLKRNESMIDSCTHVLALWDRAPAGGTYHCITYANNKHRNVINVWDEWKEYYSIIV